MLAPWKKIAVQFKPEFDLFLRAVNDKNARIVIHKPFVSFGEDKGWTYQNHVVKLAWTRAPQLVHKILGFTGVCRAHDQPVKRYVVSIHLYLILHRMELSVHNFQLRIADCENVAF